MNQPNPAKQARNRIIAAVREQQRALEAVGKHCASLQEENIELRQAVATLVVAAGVGDHPRFASLVRSAGLKVADDKTNQGDSIGGSVDTTTEQAKKPDATDDVESIGAAPGPANQGVTPQAVTDVTNSDVAINSPVLDNLQNVTAPVPGTDAVVPAAGDAAGTSTVTVGTPSDTSFDPPGSGGWKNSSKGSDQDRFVAAMRLARLQVAAGLATGEDLALAQTIVASEQPLGEITAQVNTLQAVTAARQSQAPSAEQTRRLVPRAAGRQGIAPVASQPSMVQATATTDRPDEDAWLVGSVE